MSKKSKMGLIGAGAAGLAALLASMGFVGENPYSAPSRATQEQRAAENQRRQAVTDQVNVVSENKASKLNSLAGHWKIQYKGPAGRFLNQRQYRKKVRNNPTLLKSRKHRSKNS